jgi:hypothetical protein
MSRTRHLEDRVHVDELMRKDPFDASLAHRLRSIWEDICTVDGTFAR